ncbi:hypothetical protein [Desertibacillus haloalkaliphilus]|uniref:hypothetical protein n=1 Tax=Desertibacillus haloalkaliphilus TaxID=1328930 RepID=UPI001C26630B|nr:hypothetical protein [Desertibacillus haloalkaliphilus]MBU8908550.1 hypothetical protein [Desertibacillus haloalkaliphilus]
MPQMTMDELESKLMEERLNAMFQKAYEQGVRDAIEKYSFPVLLTKQHLCEIFQVEMPTVSKLVAHPNFPKFEMIRARYPRDAVLDWINENTNWVKDNTNYFAS